jgi:hypothetical protein
MRGERRLLRIGEYLIGRACRRLPARIRNERGREWSAELPAILRDPDAGPGWRRALRMLRYAAGTIRGAALVPGAGRSPLAVRLARLEDALSLDGLDWAGRTGRSVRAGAVVVAGCLLAAGAFAVGEHQVHHQRQQMTVLTGNGYVGIDQASITVGDWVYGIQGPGNIPWLDSQGSTHESGWPACLRGPGRVRVTFGEVPVTAPDGGMWRQVVWVDCQS